MADAESPSQTAGPYVHIGLTPNFTGITGVYPEDLGAVMCGDAALGERITLEGQIFDGAGDVLRDAVVEIWQADAAGNLPPSDPDFRGWGRCASDLKTGIFRFDTVRPGVATTADGDNHAPHIILWIVARGINIGLQTRCYFPDAAQANATDPVFSAVPPDRQPRLLARHQDGVWRFDIHLQGPEETPFFDL